MASKIGAALGFGSIGDDGVEPDEDDSEESPKASSAKGEVLAMKAFMAADTAEAKAAAMKDFLELCGGY
ncbi:hypothetical protein [Acidithiobacillus sp.]|uniref:hypothetical protein n=1 Tax=Acidithiobacillus sp. TaxID=1872118 RepID=UPI002584BD52|nr:hypothetical protein [Acidithiobacillus sp.]MDD5374478.1 hypothetical protein [Acidithiobacillus sp.]